MRLQTDPSVIYGLGDKFDGNLRRRDLENDTAYNTYTRAGPAADADRARRGARRSRPPCVRRTRTRSISSRRGSATAATSSPRSLAAHNANVSRHLANLRRGRGVRVR